MPNLKDIFIKEYKDKLSGGEADKKSPSEFDQESLMKGIHVELEHTDDIETAMEIAMDHLAEDPLYYKKLDKIHKETSEDDLNLKKVWTRVWKGKNN